ncbi:hypothetical protein HMH01_08750 [Halovulum dunhuangense]|uniref:Uncharacterized protein n=1 Tax=Halovulum dunhuangense TaxID=1505036 RepID=A0A849L2F9_9RHOB|nr:DUF6477 family protein [Halovulum dunhuangense]NNU80528.1 hypothetical protein [Halovulum dunhuangense]
MPSLSDTLATLNRPRMLVGAARKGLAFYHRDRDLPRIVRDAAIGRDAASRLIEREARLETTRRTNDATYSVADHVAVLTALIAEAGLAPARG